VNKPFTARAKISTVTGVDVALFRESKLGDKPPHRDPGFRPYIELDAAIARSQGYLLGEQKPEGYWVGELMVDSTLVADTIAYHHWNGKVDAHWQRKAVNHIFSMQLADGGWNIYHGGPAEVNATIKAYLALKLAGVPVTDPRMLRARELALSLGGVPRMNTFSKLYLALLGLFPWSYVPTIPCEVILLGKWFYVNFNEMSSWSRSMLVPLAIINHFKPIRPLKNNINLNELYPEGVHERDLAPVRDPERLTWRNFFLWLDRLHKFAEWFAETGIHPFRKRALRKAEQWMLERLEGSDGLAAIFPAMLNSLIALKALGYPDDHPQVLRAERELKKLEHETEHSVRIEPCFSPVWDTAIVEICLHGSGIPSDHPALKKATDWLISREIRFHQRGHRAFVECAIAPQAARAFKIWVRLLAMIFSSPGFSMKEFMDNPPPCSEAPMIIEGFDCFSAALTSAGVAETLWASQVMRRCGTEFEISGTKGSAFTLLMGPTESAMVFTRPSQSRHSAAWSFLMYASTAAIMPTSSSLLTFMPRPMASLFGEALRRAAWIRSLRPSSRPALCGPRIPLPPENVTRSKPILM